MEITTLGTLLLLLLLVKMQLYYADAAPSNASRPGMTVRIFKGTPANPRDFPYIAYLRIESFWDARSHHVASSNRLWCTGSVVGRHWVMTAAHCLQPQYLYNAFNRQGDNRWANLQVNIAITVGMVGRDAESNANGKVYHVGIRDIFVHPQAMDYYGRNDERGVYRVDAALLWINGGFPLNNGIGSIPLMTGGFPPGHIGECVAIGFGHDGRQDWRWPQLNYQHVYMGDVNYCRRLLSDNRWRSYHLCVTGKVPGARSCGGDSGSPLVCGYPRLPVVVGIDHGTFGDHTTCGPHVDEVHYIATGHIENWVRRIVGGEVSFVPY